LSRGVTELVELVRALIARIQPKRKIAVALMGGLLEKENPYSTMMRERLQSSIPNILILKPKFPPAYGATLLALQPFST
jgi:N-acetylglucosamine kinase-like BadF-type ATPase